MKSILVEETRDCKRISVASFRKPMKLTNYLTSITQIFRFGGLEAIIALTEYRIQTNIIS